MRAPSGPALVPAALTAVGALAVAVAGVRGPDYPAHYLRAELWRRSGFGVWNFTWYGGHSTPGYSTLVPPLVALLGPVVVCVAGGVLATYLFGRLLDGVAPDVPTLGRALATGAFGVGAVVNVVVGRTNFAAGLAVLAAALLAWHRGRLVVALVLGLLTPLTSPVVGAFGAIVAAAVGLDALADRRRGATAAAGWVLAALAVPLLLLAALFGSTGHFPYRPNHVVFTGAMVIVVAAAYRARPVAIGAGITGIAALVLFSVPNPLGGNFSRFPQYVVVPVAVLATFRAGARWWAALPAAAFAVIGLNWTVDQGVLAARQWSGDPSVERAFHQHLIDELTRRNADGRPPGRVEVPFTDAHWESYYVALEFPYARGWERQIDLDRNAALYESELTDEQYRAWLADNGVRWIAVPDVALDEGGRAEAALVESGLDWLELVWSNADWQLFEVADYTPIVDAPAQLVDQDVDELVLRTDRPADVVVRYRYDDHLSIDGDACLVPDAHGWILARLPEAGNYTIGAPIAGVLPGVVSGRC